MSGTFKIDVITEEAILRAPPASLLFEMATQLTIVFRENDSLDDFLDRMLLPPYEHLRKQTWESQQDRTAAKYRQSFALSRD